MLDTEIKKTKRDSYREGSEYSHESFGIVRLAHTHGQAKTFGSEVESTSLVELTVSNCEVSQDLGRNWYHAKGNIVQVRMSSVQYAELISNPNTEGSPCTITHSEKHGSILQKHIETQTEHVESAIEKTVTELHKTVANLEREVTEILNRKGAMKKLDKDELKKLYSQSIRKINDHLPFYEECMKENIEKMKSEARADINGHIQHAINATGLATLKDPKLVQLLLERKG